MIVWIWFMFPLASLMATMLSISASLRVVEGSMLDPVLPGTLYRTRGISMHSAIALKCW